MLFSMDYHLCVITLDILFQVPCLNFLITSLFLPKHTPQNYNKKRLSQNIKLFFINQKVLAGKPKIKKSGI